MGDLLDAYSDQRSQITGLWAELENVKLWREVYKWTSVVLGLLFLFAAVTAIRQPTARPVASQQPEASEGSTTGPSAIQAANPSAAILPCEQGKWVTILGSWQHDKGLAGDLFIKLREIQKRAEENGVELQINYTPRGEEQCDTLSTDYYVFWNGPHPDSKAAINVCHRLGWTTEADDDWCFARAIDPAHQGEKHIRPDEG